MSVNTSSEQYKKIMAPSFGFGGSLRENLVLSGDNAVVIALACRNLSPELQKKAVFWGSFGAIGL